MLRIIDRVPSHSRVYALSGLILDAGALFITDTHMVPDPTTDQIAEMTIAAAAEIAHFGLKPRVALLSHSNFGSSHTDSARKMRRAYKKVRDMAPHLAVDGEMHADAALSESLREPLIGDGVLKGSANLLIMPSLDAANISFNMVRMLADGVDVGPILLGMDLPCHVLHENINARGIVDMTALAVVEAQGTAEQELPL